MVSYGIIFCVSLAVCYFFGEKHGRLCAFIIGLLMAVLAFSMDVHPSSDLNRYYYYLDFFRDQSFKKSFLFAIIQNNPLHYISLMLCTVFANNQMYTAVFTFIDYFLVLKLVGNTCNDYNLSKKHYLVCVAFVLMNLNFFLVVNVIRIFFVFAVFFYCLYEESIRKKHKILCIIIYVMLVFYHYAALILLAARIFSIIMNTSRHTWGYTIKMSIIALAFVGYAVLINTSFGGYVSSKIMAYSDYTVRGTWQTIIGIIQFVMVGTMSFSKQRECFLDIKSYKLVIIALIVINILTLDNYQMILRFGNAMIMGASGLYMCLYHRDDDCFSLSNMRVFECVNCIGTVIVFAYTMIYYYYTFL